MIILRIIKLELYDTFIFSFAFNYECVIFTELSCVCNNSLRLVFIIYIQFSNILSLDLNGFVMLFVHCLLCSYVPYGDACIISPAFNYSTFY